MTSTAAQVSFAAELVTMLVALAGVVLVVRGREMAGQSRSGQGLLGAGFVALGVVSFLDGSTIVSADAAGLAVARLVSCGLLVGGSLAARPTWPAGVERRSFLGLGLALVAAASVLDLAASVDVAAAVLLGVGSLAIGVPVAAAGRRSIATRVAIAVAGTLLLVLVLVAVAMSEVISSSVQNTDLSRMAERATVQGYQVADQVNDVVKNARLEASGLNDYFRTMAPDPLTELGSGGGPAGAAQARVQGQLAMDAGLYPVAGGGFAYVLPKASLILATGDLARSAQSLARFHGVLATSCPSNGSGSLEVVDGQVYAVGQFPECSSTNTVLGTVLAVTPLNDAYLAQQRRSTPSVGLALASDGATLASSGPAVPDPSRLAAVTARAASSGTSSATTVDGAFVAVQPVAAGAPSGLQVIASSTESALIDTRDKLFRTLFLVALGSSVVALALAVLVGERITAGLRRLTDVVGRVGATPAGTLPRAGSLGTDEVGVLGRAFDTMLDEVEVRAADLQAAADDETRLRNRLQAVVAGINDGLVAVDVNGRIIEINAAAERLLGVGASDVLGTPAAEVLVADGSDPNRLADRIGHPAPAAWEVETEIRTPDGPVPVTVSAGATRGPSGELIGAVLVVRDLRSEQELERMKTEFLSRVGHELRTPLTGIMGYADILSRRQVDPTRAQQWYTEILGSARRLLRIVEMLEFFASAGAGRVRLRPEVLEPASLVAGVAAKWSGALGADHPIVRRIHETTPPILADRRWLVMALDELLDNAAKFSPPGGRIAICAAPAGAGEPDRAASDLGGSIDAGGNEAGGNDAAPASSPSDGRTPWVEIAVVDRGEGMTAEQQAVAFGEFVQADASDTRSYGGLGLGLALVKRVVEGHGGTVVCRTAVGEGSTFVLRLPTAPEHSGS